MPIDIAISAGNIYVALMSKSVKIYDPIGRPIETVCFDTHIISLVDVTIQTRQLPYCCVATVNGELTFLSKGERIDVMQLEEGVSALFFGLVGREPYNLLSISKHGGLFLRTLSRTTAEKPESGRTRAEKGEPIPIPKKTQLFLTKCENERKTARDMFMKWKNSIRYLYMLSANTYAKILESSAVSPIDDVSFIAKVCGMGPEFVLNVTIVNNGKEAIAMVKVIVKYNPRMYKLTPQFVDLPTMVGGYQYTARFELTSIDPDGKADVLNVVAVGPQFPMALCSSIVQVPVSQFPTV
jgi:Bardet-Biedl syndrome 1 protein